jgi:protocatechuate 3,4-dioxygenase alpha subunit
MSFKQTPSQTIGPFFAYGLTSEQYGYQLDQIAGGNLLAAAEGVGGERIRIVGQVFDGEGQLVPDAMIEIWQADAQGRYAHPADARGTNTGFKGFGRMGTGTDPECRFVFDTIKPGPVDDAQAPHISVAVFARGMPLHAFTRIYFGDEETANARDPVLALVPHERRGTLIAEKGDTDGVATYRFDIRLQGDGETVFLDI